MLAKNLKSAKENKEDIQKIVFDSIKQSGLNPRDAFRAFYQKLTGKDFGPKAGDLILEQGIDAVISKLHSTSN